MTRLQHLLLLVVVLCTFSMCFLAFMNRNTYMLPSYGNIVLGDRNYETMNSKHIVSGYRNHEATNSKPKETIMIQLRNGFHRHTTLYEEFTKGYNKPISTCKFAQCKYLPGNTTIIPDVLIFHMSDPPELPAKRLPSQKYIFFTRESEELKIRWQVQYNLTMTMRRDSDIHVPLYYVKKKEDSKKRMLINNFNFATGKSKKIAWLVSNCHTRSKREIYVEQLRKYIDIDIYGECGDLSCEHSKECWSYINATYKFYLSFENSICIDYYTEKVGWILYMGGMVPVVMGGADYSKFLPPHSYIDVMDFPSPRALAEYLHLLDGNDTLYNEYFGWQGHHKVIFYRNKFHCHLCKYLHKHRDEIKVYNDIRMWYNPATRCRRGNWSHYDLS